MWGATPSAGALILLCVFGQACSRDAPALPDKGVSAQPSGALAASTGALDWLTWLDCLDLVCAVPQHALRYANGLPDEFLSAERPRFANFRAEALLVHRPRLVICDAYQNALTVRALERAGVQVCVLRAIRSFEDLEENARSIVHALGAADLRAITAETVVARLRDERDALARSKSAAAPTSVLPYYELGGQISTAGRGTSEDLVLTLAGARNHAASLGLEGHARVPIESLLRDAPEAILVSAGPQREALLARARMASFEAVKQRRFVVLSPRLRQANSPYLLEAARQVRKQLDAPGMRSSRER